MCERRSLLLTPLVLCVSDPGLPDRVLQRAQHGPAAAAQPTGPGPARLAEGGATERPLELRPQQNQTGTVQNRAARRTAGRDRAGARRGCQSGRGPDPRPSPHPSHWGSSSNWVWMEVGPSLQRHTVLRQRLMGDSGKLIEDFGQNGWRKACLVFLWGGGQGGAVSGSPI